MLRIREKQLAVIGARALERFKEEARTHVVALDAPRFRGASPATIASWIDERLERRAFVGLVDDGPTVLRWLEIAAIHGDEASEEDHVLRTLGEPGRIEPWATTRAALDAHLAHAERHPMAPADDGWLARAGDLGETGP